MAVITSGPGYNGVTGAKATYSPDEGMWIDVNGERIRSDAIVPGEPPAKAASPTTAPAAAPPAASAATPGATLPGGATGAGAGGGGGGAVPEMPTSMMPFMSMGGGSSAGAEPIPAARSTSNPNLGKRIYPQSMQAIARLGRAAY